MTSGSALGETLQDAVSHMLRTNPKVREVSFKRLARDQEVVKAKARYYPSLDLYMGKSLVERHRPTHYKVDSSQSTITLHQNVFEFFGTTYEVLRNKERVNSSAYELQAESEDIALQACRVYLDVLRKIELYDLAKENLTTHQQIYDQMKLRSQSGVDSKADLDQVVGRLALAQSNIAVTMANVADAKTDYLRVIGRMPEDLKRPDAVDVLIPKSQEEAEELAAKQRPRLKSAMADLRARKHQYRTAKSQFYPVIDLAVDYSWEDDVSEPGNVEEFRATGSISYNIFRGLWNQGRLKETKYLIAEANEILKNAMRETIQSIRLSWEAYKTARERVTHLEEYVNSTGLTVEAFGKQWMIGRRTMFDVLDTRAEYINAKSDLVEAVYDKMYSEYRILNGIGTLVHSLDLKWPAESRVEEAKVSGVDPGEKESAYMKALYKSINYPVD
jgi:adhesin transport system outer membrane protein